MERTTRETLVESDDQGMRQYPGPTCGGKSTHSISITPRPVEDDFDPKDGGMGSALEFAVVHDLGSGGEGRVLTIEYPGGQRYALKVFKSAVSARNEWDVLNAQKNSRVVPYPYLIGTINDASNREDDGQWCIVMENIEGRSLQSLIEERFRMGEVFPMEECASILGPIIRFAANSCASRRADVHRDVKPDNIIIESAGETRLVDFAFSARTGSESVGGSGSYGYSAPELQGRTSVFSSSPRNDPRVDTYSIAAVMLVMLSGIEPARQRAYDVARLRAVDPEVQHDQGTIDRLVSALRDDVHVNYGMNPSESVLRNSVFAALANTDADLKDALLRALSIEQDERPTPLEFESRLAHIINGSIYENQIIMESRARCYAYERGALPVLSTETDGDHLITEGTFIDGLNAFNRGDYLTALPILRRQSRLGNASASYYLAVCLRDGLGVGDANRDEIVSLLTEAANQGNILAMNALGRLLLEKTNLDASERDRAIEWIRSAAARNESQGNPGFKPAKDWLSEQGIR